MNISTGASGTLGTAGHAEPDPIATAVPKVVKSFGNDEVRAFGGASH